MTSPPLISPTVNPADPIVGSHPAAVSMTSMDATGFVFTGAKFVNTPAGPLKVLVFHADHLVADHYALRATAGPATALSGDLDIGGVDIYATRLSGTVAVPVLHIPPTPITLTPDLVPTWLPIEISLPLFAGTDLTVGQAYIRADSVRGTGLGIAARGNG